MLRELGTFERALFISNRHSPFNVIGVVQLENPPTPAILQAALEILQKRHTLLQVRIANADTHPLFELMPETELPLSIIQRKGDKQWVEIVEQEMAIRFDVAIGPLFRVSYLYEENRAEIVITFLHSIMDAVSGTNLIDELLGMAALLKSGEQKELSSLELAQPVEEQFPPAFKGARRIPVLLAYFFSQMGEEMGYRWKVRGKRVARVQPGGKGHILSLTLPETLLESISQRARSEKVTLNSLLNASMLLAVNRHLYGGVSQPMQTFAFANLRPYIQPPSPKEDLVSHISMLRYTVKVSKSANIWDLTRYLHTRIYASLKFGSKFSAALMSESLMKMFTGIKSMRMASTALNYTAAVALHKSYGDIKVTGLHAYISAMDIGPELAAQARIFNDQLWVDFMYLDSDMDAPLAEKIVAEIQLILEQAGAGPFTKPE
jgi:NRPS condensation-like uncharacterized protein